MVSTVTTGPVTKQDRIQGPLFGTFTDTRSRTCSEKRSVQNEKDPSRSVELANFPECKKRGVRFSVFVCRHFVLLVDYKTTCLCFSDVSF